MRRSNIYSNLEAASFVLAIFVGGPLAIIGAMSIAALPHVSAIERVFLMMVGMSPPIGLLLLALLFGKKMESAKREEERTVPASS